MPCGVTSDLAAVLGSLVEWLVGSPRGIEGEGNNDKYFIVTIQ